MATHRAPDAPAPAEEDASAAVADDLPIPPSLLGLSVGGLTRRRLAWIAAALVTAWVVIVFGRQVGEASAASARATQLSAENDRAAAELRSLRLELDLVSRPAYVDLAARAERLGTGREQAFTIAPGAPPLPDDAPGSAATAVGAEDRERPPVEVWLSLLFGPAD
jgi:hypothetical protein